MLNQHGERGVIKDYFTWNRWQKNKCVLWTSNSWISLAPGNILNLFWLMISRRMTCLVYVPFLGPKKNLNFICPLPGKKLSHFPCSRLLLASFHKWFCQRMTCLDPGTLAKYKALKITCPAKKIYWMALFWSPASPLDKWARWDLFSEHCFG